jgi:diaminohydroxyphosphoribosylaminopyrimidine deaminase/5-amino-6-(5-phosphoribosylamino)uracil reductase
MVGSVVVNDAGEIIAEGWHQMPGQSHAEPIALDLAGDAARGATLYVSLEPCCHHGKTPPCSDRVIASGVRRVVCGLEDPNPKVAGGGIAALRAAGISVEVGILEKECRYLNRAWLKWITSNKTPWVILKMAATLDGKIADRNGNSRWITGAHARQFVHETRNRVDCVLIGGQTAVVDHAELTVRDVKGSRNPLRAVLDTQLLLPPDSKLALNPDGKTLVFTSADALATKGSRFGEHVRFVETPLTHDGKLSLPFVLDYLGKLNVLSVMCEGGGRLAASMLPYTDEIYWMVAPKFLADNQAMPSINSDLEVTMPEVRTHSIRDVRRIGDDVLLNILLQN